VDKDELQGLYQACDASIMPSLTESLSSTHIEAMHWQCPQVERLLGSSELRQQLVHRGIERVKGFPPNWTAMAEASTPCLKPRPRARATNAEIPYAASRRYFGNVQMFTSRFVTIAVAGSGYVAAECGASDLYCHGHGYGDRQTRGVAARALHAAPSAPRDRKTPPPLRDGQAAGELRIYLFRKSIQQLQYSSAVATAGVW
jgi:hypothetical protein